MYIAALFQCGNMTVQDTCIDIGEVGSVKRKNEFRNRKPTSLIVSVGISIWEKTRVSQIQQQLRVATVIESILPPG